MFFKNNPHNCPPPRKSLTGEEFEANLRAESIKQLRSEAAGRLKNNIPSLQGREDARKAGEGYNQTQSLLQKLFCINSRNLAQNNCRLDILAQHETMQERGSKRAAFTLAEVLITLGIIGVVAVMTISPLIANYREKVLIHQLEVANSVLSEGFQQAINDNGEVLYWAPLEDRLQFIYDNIIPKYFNVIKTCEDGHKEGCAAPSGYKFLKGNASTAYVSGKTFVLSNGMVLSFYPTNLPAYTTYHNCTLKTNFQYILDNMWGGTYFGKCAQFYIDVNGKKGPNTIGKDVFNYYLVADGIIPSGSPKETVWCQKFYDSSHDSGCTKHDDGNACTAWALYNKNMDYLHCDGLNWDNAHTCKELNK